MLSLRNLVWVIVVNLIPDLPLSTLDLRVRCLKRTKLCKTRSLRIAALGEGRRKSSRVFDL